MFGIDPGEYMPGQSLLAPASAAESVSAAG
jgi:hypothetical protein